MRYLASYTAKKEQKTVPSGGLAPGRWWGIVGLRDTVEAGITWSHAKHATADVCEALNEIQKLRNTAQKQNKMRRKVLDIDGTKVVLWLWDVDDRVLQSQLTSLVDNLREAVRYEHRLQCD